MLGIEPGSSGRVPMLLTHELFLQPPITFKKDLLNVYSACVNMPHVRELLRGQKRRDPLELELTGICETVRGVC